VIHFIVGREIQHDLLERFHTSTVCVVILVEKILSSMDGSKQLLRLGQCHSYFTTKGLPPISSSWRQAPCG
jgi:hypothetical protein